MVWVRLCELFGKCHRRSSTWRLMNVSYAVLAKFPPRFQSTWLSSWLLICYKQYSFCVSGFIWWDYVQALLNFCLILFKKDMENNLVGNKPVLPEDASQWVLVSYNYSLNHLEKWIFLPQIMLLDHSDINCLVLAVPPAFLNWNRLVFAWCACIGKKITCEEFRSVSFRNSWPSESKQPTHLFVSSFDKI